MRLSVFCYQCASVRDRNVKHFNRAMSMQSSPRIQTRDISQLITIIAIYRVPNYFSCVYHMCLVMPLLISRVGMTRSCHFKFQPEFPNFHGLVE